MSAAESKIDMTDTSEQEVTQPVAAGGERLFVPCSEQLRQLRQWNDNYRLGFTTEALDAVGPPPAWPAGRLQAVVLAWSLGTVHRTAEIAWRIAADQQPGSRRWQEVEFRQQSLRLRPDIGFVPFALRWDTVDLGTQHDRHHPIRPVDVRGATSLHAQGLQAAAYFPQWVQTMDGVTVPYLWLAGYELKYGAQSSWMSLKPRWQTVPVISWSNKLREVSLYGSEQGWALSACVVGELVRRNG